MSNGSMQRSEPVKGAALVVLLLALHTVLVESGGAYGGGGGGGFGHGPVLGDANAFGCRPQVHYITHYRTKFQDVPVYKTVIATDVAVKNRNELVYSTVVNIETVSLTSTVLETTTEIVTSVARSEVIKTITNVVSVPYYTTTIEYLQQTRVVDITSHVFDVAEYAYPVTLTEVATAAATIDLPVTVVEKSAAPLFRDHIILNTITKYVTVTHTNPGYGYQNDVAYVTQNVVDYTPSYVTKTQYKTKHVTHTTFVNVPSYSTVFGPCNYY
ncbi:uncharacterized protein LOC127003431 [Eriocheir sinensis]|uniref:uncharacterized protein LOC127003431 n=1 Tax=Eriocheir sinensis TaxID=95602 RepID=UPI0021C572A9|nr:uncharacterized protein LOC127003431 [Eriocheir sinensis]